MVFHSRFLDHVPFSTLRPREGAPMALSALERAERALKNGLADPSTLMYSSSTGLIYNAKTGKLFNGKVRIASELPEDKFERIVSVKNGIDESALVRLKTGEKYYFQSGNKEKTFPINLSAEEIKEQTERLIRADDSFYSKLMENFSKRKIFTTKK